jgi:hypothetical protein
MQRNKALQSNKKIWLIQIIYSNEVDKYNSYTLLNRYKSDLVYVVDNSMSNAIKKAIYHFGKRTGIKKLKQPKHNGLKENLKIHVRRATKMEIINVRAGIGCIELKVI